MLHALIITVLVAYVGGTVAALILLAAPGKKWRELPVYLAMIGVLAHTASYGYLLDEALPLIGKGDYYYVVAWLLALLFILLRKRWNSPPIAGLALGFATLFVVSSSLLVHHESAERVAAFGTSLFLLHIVPAMAAEVALVFAFILSLNFLYKELLLKRRSAASLSQGGPSLTQLDKTAHRFLLIGFVAMTVAVLSGTVWALEAGSSLVSRDPLQWSAFFVWVVLGVLLHGRENLRWSMRRMALVTTAGVGLVLLLFLALVVAEGNIFHAFS